MSLYAIGVDVGSGSVRAGLVSTTTGEIYAVSTHPITTTTDLPYKAQSSDNIWSSVTHCIKSLLTTTSLPATSVVGLSFDATCSLVLLNATDAPIPSYPPAETNATLNVVHWSDQRAVTEAGSINATAHPLLSLVGGKISPEMQLPKLLHLKTHLPASYAAATAGKALDLSDYLLYRATDYEHDTRSLCTTVCKWCYDAAAGAWDLAFLAKIGLGEVTGTMIGNEVKPIGSVVKGGIGALAARELGLEPGTPLAVGLIDAHAGGLGCVGAGGGEVGGRLCMVSGTSCCHMFTSPSKDFVPGVWGPYYGAMVPGMYLNEGGQSAAGSAVDYVVRSHAAYKELLAKADGRPEIVVLNEIVEEMGGSNITNRFHVTPDFIGNRSPLSDPMMRGAVCGLGMGSSVADLAVLYCATVQALAYSSKMIVEKVEGAGHEKLDSLYLCGGLTKNSLFVQTSADVLGIAVCLPAEEEAVLVGAAVAAAAEHLGGVEEAMRAMTKVGARVEASGGEQARAFHEKKYRVFRRMMEDQAAYRDIMEGT